MRITREHQKENIRADKIMRKENKKIKISTAYNTIDKATRDIKGLKIKSFGLAEIFQLAQLYMLESLIKAVSPLDKKKDS